MSFISAVDDVLDYINNNIKDIGSSSGIYISSDVLPIFSFSPKFKFNKDVEFSPMTTVYLAGHLDNIPVYVGVELTRTVRAFSSVKEDNIIDYIEIKVED